MSRAYQTKQYSFPRYPTYSQSGGLSPLAMETKNIGKLQAETNQLLRNLVEICAQGLRLNEKSLKILEDELCQPQDKESKDSSTGVEEEDQDDQEETI